jgi:hypothetical protein
VQLWEHRESAHDGYPATSFVVRTPAGKEVILVKIILVRNELDLPRKRTLKPGEIGRHTVTLSQWPIKGLGPRTFDKPGKYTVHCVFYPFDPFGDPYGFGVDRDRKKKRVRLESPAVSITMTAS